MLFRQSKQKKISHYTGVPLPKGSIFGGGQCHATSGIGGGAPAGGSQIDDDDTHNDARQASRPLALVGLTALDSGYGDAGIDMDFDGRYDDDDDDDDNANDEKQASSKKKKRKTRKERRAERSPS